jgi:hypothetical protein
MSESEEKTYNLHYHLKPFKVRIGENIITTEHVSVTAVVVQKGDSAILNFGFSKLKKGDQFSRKYGRELTTLRANKDATLVVGFKKEFITNSFLSIAKHMGKEIAFGTQLGVSLISDLKLPEKVQPVKEKIKFTEEQIAELRKQKLGQFLAAEQEGIV